MDFPCFCYHSMSQEYHFILNKDGHFYFVKDNNLVIDNYSSGIENLREIKDKSKIEELVRREIKYYFSGEEHEF